LDAGELTTWLTRVTQTIDRSLREQARAEAATLLAEGLSLPRLALPVLMQLALLDDCLRVAHLAIEADGKVDTDELARVTDLVRIAASKYFCVLPVYEHVAELTASPSDVTLFLRTHRN